MDSCYAFTFRSSRASARSGRCPNRLTSSVHALVDELSDGLVTFKCGWFSPSARPSRLFSGVRRFLGVQLMLLEMWLVLLLGERLRVVADAGDALQI